MGYAISRLLSINTMAESFMITYLSRQGITPYTMDLIPGGSLRDGDDANVRRHKFKMALKRQRQLGNALRQIERGLYRCQSPCFVRVFDEELEVDVNENTVVNEFKWMRGEGDEGRTRLNRRQSRNGFGALERLVSDTGRRDSIQIGGVAVSSEEIVAYDVVREQKVAKPLRGSQKEKRSRSRPERRMRKAAGVPGAGKRQSMSVTHVVLREPEPHLLPPLICSLSRAVERIQLGCLKKARKAWPSSDAVRNVLKDPTSRPTTYFIARFRSAPDDEYVEVDYRYKANGKDFFQITSGSLEKLLTGEALIQYLADKQNNNLDEKVTFFRNFSRIFNNLEGRIWWNGYIVCVDGSVSSRIRVKTVMFDPPAFIFDLSGLQHISATRNDTRLSFIGNNGQAGEGEGEGTGEIQPTVNRSFVIRGRTEHDIKQLNITHAEGTTLVSITLPTLSGIPVSTKNSGAKVATGTKSDGSMIGQLEAQTA